MTCKKVNISSTMFPFFDTYIIWMQAKRVNYVTFFMGGVFLHKVMYLVFPHKKHKERKVNKYPYHILYHDTSWIVVIAKNEYPTISTFKSKKYDLKFQNTIIQIEKKLLGTLIPNPYTRKLKLKIDFCKIHTSNLYKKISFYEFRIEFRIQVFEFRMQQS